MRAERAGKDAELARREEDMRVHLDQTQRLHKQMECMLRQESAEHVRELGQRDTEWKAYVAQRDTEWEAYVAQRDAELDQAVEAEWRHCLLYTSPSPRD